MKRLMLCFLLVATPAHAASSPTVAEVLRAQKHAAEGDFGGRALWAAQSFYLQGLIEGIGLSHQAQRDAGLTTLICPPEGWGLSLQQATDLLETAERQNGDTPVAKALLDGLARLHPC